MKRILLMLIISIVAVLYADAQRISPTTHSSCGASLEQSGVSLEFTIGGTVIETMQQSNVKLYNDFHTPDCAPEGIGQINGCGFLCAQDAFTVYHYTLAGVLNMDETFWTFSPANAVEIDLIGNDFVDFKIIDSTVTQIVVNVTPRNYCGDGISVANTIQLDTDCVVPGDVDGNRVINDNDMFTLFRAKRQFFRENIETYSLERNLPCPETGMTNKYDFGLHPAHDWDSLGHIYKFMTLNNSLRSFKHADINGDEQIRIGSGASDWDLDLDSDVLYSDEHYNKVALSLYAESSTPGLHYTVIDTTTSNGDAYMVKIYLGDALNTFDVDIVSFGLGFKEGLHNNPGVDYSSTHFGSLSDIYYADYIDRNPDDTSYAYITIGSKTENSLSTFSGEHVCGVICEITPTLNSEADSLFDGAVPYNFFIGDLTLYDAQGNKTIVSGESITILVEPISKPKKVLATSINSHQNNISWNAHLSNPEYFIVERYLNDTLILDQTTTIFANAFQSFDTLNNGSFLFLDTSNIIPDQIYYYRIKSVNDTIGSTSWSEWREVTSGPAAPDSLTLQSTFSTSIDLTWNDNSPYIDSTFVEMNTGNGVFVPVGASPFGDWTHYDLQPNSPYCYRVRTRNEFGVFSDYDTIQCCFTMPSVPNTPNNLSAEPLGNTAIVTWDIDSNSIIDKVYINRLKFSSSSAPQGFNDTIAAVNITQYIDTTVEQGYMYCYRLFTENASGASYYSDTICVLLCDMPTLTTETNGDTIKLTWTDNCLSESEYLVQTIDRITGDTTITVFPYNTTSYEYVLPSDIDTFNNCYAPAFHVVNGLYHSPYGNADCENGFIGTHISTHQILNRNEQFKIYPNPTSNLLMVENLDNNVLLDDLKLLNLDGQLIFDYVIHQQQMTLDLSDLPNGVYILQLNNEIMYRIIKVQ